MGTYKVGEDFRNHDAFQMNNGKFTDEQLYWIGWLASDGYVYKNFIRLSLQSSDKLILEQFQKFIGAKSCVNVVERNMHQVVITSDKIVSDLKNLGITERKSLTLTLDKKLVNSPLFWRGYFQGDGCISTSNKIWNFQITSGSYNLLVQWCEFICLPVKYIYQRENSFDFIIGKQSEVHRIFITLYGLSIPGLRLERKYEKFLAAYLDISSRIYNRNLRKR
jgi:hypothetical protein